MGESLGQSAGTDQGISENVVWYVVRCCAQRLELEHIAPHDLRRTCAKLCHSTGENLSKSNFFSGTSLF